MKNLECVHEQNLREKRVLVRVDFNVPMEEGVIQDSTRIRQTLRTVRYLKKHGAKIIIISHFGKTARSHSKQSLNLLVAEASKIYDSKIVFINDCLHPNAEQIIATSKPDEIILMENLRFYMEEESCDIEFAKKLAAYGEFFINEAFPVSHRKHASICLIPKFLKSAIGFAFADEIKAIDSFFDDSDKPKMCIIGGSKLSTKINLLKNLTKKVDKLALGGGIAGAFLSLGKNNALKIFDPKEYEKDVLEILENAKQYNCELIMPIDFSALIHEKDILDHTIISTEENNATVFDIGPESVNLFKKHLDESKTILWNGPVGLFERVPFDFGTRSIAEHIGQLTENSKIKSIIGGGDTGFAMKKFGVNKQMSYISTAGGAFLTYLEDTELPGITAVKDCAV